MENLTRTLPSKWVLQKNGVVYDVVTKEPKDEACSVKLTEDNCPKFTVDGTDLYMHYYIEDGDVFSEDTFMKTIHGDDETCVNYNDYYKTLCEDTIKESLTSKVYYTYEDYVNHPEFLDVPRWMLKLEGEANSEIVPDKQITFSREYYEAKKKEGVGELAMASASETAFRYGYKITGGELQLEEL